MCSATERTFPGKNVPDDFAGQGGELAEPSGEGGSADGDNAGEGGVGNLAGAGAEAGESSAGESSAGEAGTGGREITGAAGTLSNGGTTATGAGSAGKASGGGGSGGGGSGGTTASGGSAGTVAANGGSAGVNGAGGSAGGVGCPSASSRCVQAAPTGWQGPLLVTANAVNSCPSEFPTKSPAFYSGLVPGNASCACNCGAPTVSCGGTASLGFHNDTGCPMGIGGIGVPENMCTPQQFTSQSMTYQGSVSASCNAAVVEKTLPTPTWTQAMNACSGAQAQGTCSASNEVCVAKPGAPFAAKYCVARDGDQTCPAAYPARSVLFAGYQDNRACPSSCSCTASGTPDCALQVEVYSKTDCTGTFSRKTVPSSGSQVCAISSSTPAHGFIATRVVTSAGTCSANSTLSPTGSVSESGPTTLCCTE